MKTKSFAAITLICTALLAQAKINPDTNASLHKIDRKFFIENKGQWHSDVLYLCRMGGLDAWITKYGVNYTFYKLEEIPSENKAEHHLPDIFKHKDYNVIGHRVLMKLQNHNPNPVSEGKQKQEEYYNYFIGNDPSKHATYVGLYKEAVIKNVYDGIDLRYYFDKGNLRYDYVVHPGADPSQIVFTLEGSDKTYVNEKGNLVFTTCFGEVAMAELRVYQGEDGKEVKSRFLQNNRVWVIELGNYDPTFTLIIDPLIYSTYIGGSGDEGGKSIALDGSGNAYVTGWVQSLDYDTTSGTFQTTYGGGWTDVFVTKLNATGTSLIYSTYIGGRFEERSYSIAINGVGDVYITGWTTSDDYAITTGAFQIAIGGGEDVFVTKLNATGTALVYSTYIGGSSGDFGYFIKIDEFGNAYITGSTYSTDYDITPGAFQTGNGGWRDVFVTKLNATGTALIYSTYIGGSMADDGSSIAIDGAGNVYVTGLTISSDYDITSGAFQTTHRGMEDVFVTKLNATGTALIYSTYIGGSSRDAGCSIAIDESGNAYVTGYTESLDYEITSGTFQTTSGGMSDVFITKLNATGTALIYSTYLGGSNHDFGFSIAIDGSGNTYIAGDTWSYDYDITQGAFQTTSGGLSDVFITKLNATGTALIYSTYIGGSKNDNCFTFAIDESGKAYISGDTQSPDFDISLSAYQTTHGGGMEDVFITKLDLSAINAIHNVNINSFCWSLYPNPSSGTFTLQTEKGGVFELIDMTGRRVNTFTLQNAIEQIQVNIPNGMYFIREIETGTSQKLIIE